MKLLNLLLLLTPTLGIGQCLNVYTLSGPATVDCPGNTYTFSDSEVGVNYYLQDATSQTIIDGPFAGTGNSIDFFYDGSFPFTNLQVNAVADTNFSLDFNGTLDNVNIPSNPILKPTTAITIEAWVNPRDISTNLYYEIYRKEDGADRHLLAFQDNGATLAFGIGTGGVYDEIDVPINPVDYENQWVHIAATYDGSNKRIFRNGVEIGIKPTTGGMSNSGGAAIHIGSFGGVAEFFNGKIDELRVWDYARSSVQIQNGMNNCLPLNNSGLLLYLTMNDGSGPTITDHSPNAFSATLLEGLSAHSNPNGEWVTGLEQLVSNQISVNSVAVANAIYVDQNATGNNTGNDWSNAYLTISQAMNCATSGDNIYIAEGTYMEGAELYFPFSINLYGGYATGGIVYDPSLHPTIIDGQSSHRLIHCDPTPGTATLTIDGLILQNGAASNLDGGAAVNLHSVGLENQLNMSNCVIQNNIQSGALIGGGAVRQRLGNALITNCDFINNQATASGQVEGGALYVLGELHVETSAFNGNSANSTASYAQGGAIYVFENFEAHSCEFTDNTVSSSINAEGGAVFSSDEVLLTNVTIANNSSSDEGGGYHNESAGLPLVILNSVIHGNTAPLEPNIHYGTSATTLEFSLIENDFPTGVGNLDDSGGTINPGFVDAGNGDFSLLSSSILVDKGGPAHVNTTTDVDENHRFVWCNPDIGAHEYQHPLFNITNWYVDSSNTSGPQDGQSWATAFSSPDSLVGMCTNGKDTVRIAKGTYNTNACIVFYDGVVMYGGYPTGGGQRDIPNNPTILDGQSSHSLCYPLANSSFKGIIFQNGLADGTYAFDGGAIVTTSILQLDSCEFRGNNAPNGKGGAVYCDNQLNVDDCYFANNSAALWGGAIATHVLWSKRSVFMSNTCGYSGGAVYSTHSVNMSHSNFSKNRIEFGSAGGFLRGGALFTNFNATLAHCSFYDNAIVDPGNSTRQGGGLWSLGTIEIDHCHFHNNKIDTVWAIPTNYLQGANIYLESNDYLNIQNSILDGHNASGVSNFHASDYVIFHSYIQGEYPTAGGSVNNIDDTAGTFDPLYVDPSNGDFHLMPNSPLINAGASILATNDVFDIDEDGITFELAPDFDFNERLSACETDIGLYEHQQIWGSMVNDTGFCDTAMIHELVSTGNQLHWYTDAGLSSLAGTGDTLIIGNTLGSYTYYLADTTVNCPMEVMDTVTATVNLLPNINLGADTAYCAGDSILLDAGPGYTYNWSTTEVNQSIYVTQGNYDVVITDGNNCMNSDTIMVFENPLPNLDLGMDTSYCFGDSVMLDAGSGYTYNWSTSETSQSIYVTTGSFDVTVTDGNNCQSSDTILISENALPSVMAMASDSSVCIGEMITLSGSGANSYSWSSGVIDGIAFTPASSGSYQVTGTDLNNCSDTASVFIMVNSLPQLDLGVDTAICDTNSMLVLDAGVGLAGYLWNTLDTTQTINVDGGLLGVGTHSFNVSVTNSNGCENTDTIVVTVEVCTGVFDYVDNGVEINVYPNPASEYIMIETYDIMQDWAVELLDATGRVVWSGVLGKSKSQKINLSNYSKGSYFLRIDNQLIQVLKQ